MLRIPAASLALAAFAIFPGVPCSQAQQPALHATDALRAVAADGNAPAALNLEFRDVYAQARAAALTHATPIILFNGERLVLLRSGERQEGALLPKKYHDLKSFAHVPLTIYLVLRTSPQPMLDDETVGRLKKLNGLLAAAQRELPLLALNAEELSIQERLLAQCRSYLEDIAQKGGVESVSVTAFASRMRPFLEQNLRWAAELEASHYRRQAEKWRTEMSAEEWRTLRVVVIGSQMPRRRHRVVQLFAALLNEPGEGARIVYAEGLGEEGRALNLLGTHILDTAAAEAFFGNPARLNEDLLGEATAEYLRKNPPLESR